MLVSHSPESLGCSALRRPLPFQSSHLLSNRPHSSILKVPRNARNVGLGVWRIPCTFVTSFLSSLPLSAATSPKELYVVVGTNDLTNPHLEIKQVTSITLHAGYVRATMDNDIGLLLLASPIKFNGLKVPVCLPPQPSPVSWQECWVAGWGQTSSTEKNSMKSELMKVPMVIMDWKECSKLFSKLTKNMLCAGYQNENYDACQGDSGGPLVCTTSESSSKWYQLGIISWGRSCGQKNVPGIYTLLAEYDSWIKNVTQLEGRPYSLEEMRDPLKQPRQNSGASASPVPGSPTAWLLPCLLPSLLRRTVFNW